MSKIKLLVPVDFSDKSEICYRVVETLSNKHEVEVTFIHINQLPLLPPTYYVAGASFNQLQKDIEENNKRRLEEISELPYFSKAERITKYIPDVVNGVGDEIAEYSNKGMFDCVIVGNKNRSTFEQVVIGTELYKIVRLSHVPVFTFNTGILPTIKHILFFTDFSYEVNKCLPKLGKIAGLYDAEVSVVHISTTQDFLTNRAFNQQKVDFIQYFAKEDIVLRDILHYNGHTLEEGILHCAEDFLADVVALPTHGRTGVSRILQQSVSEEIIKSSILPVLTLRI